ncbi:MAG: hypothetical protein HY673_17805 [Chloroflexi bacterium]|nr:hypothetical protein [Chloroflexota bacterium]
MLRKFEGLILDPYPLRTIAKGLIRRFKIGNYEQRVKIGAVDRPWYGYIVYNAAVLAKKLGYPRISVLEFGVAGGNGLVNLEEHARQISKLCSVDIDIFGFDTGRGLPEPSDYRDLPYCYKEGFYEMDIPKLQAKLKSAKLVLGDITDAGKSFFEKFNPAPIGAISYDFDLYSSTVMALSMLERGEKYYLPRVFCYFDDIIGTEIELFNDYTGERLAINEFNQTHRNIKLGIPYHLVSAEVVEPWYHRIYACHFFEHSRYNDLVTGGLPHELPLQ